MAALGGVTRTAGPGNRWSDQLSDRWSHHRSTWRKAGDARWQFAVCGVGRAGSSDLREPDSFLSYLCAAWHHCSYSQHRDDTKVIAGWFDRNRGFALGFAGGVGNGAGAAIAPIFVAMLIANFGWRGAHLGIALAVVAIGFPVLFLWLRDAPAKYAAEKDAAAGMTLAEARKTKPFWIILIAVALGAGCMTAVFAHVVPMLVDRNISMERAVSVLVTFSLVTAVWQVGVGYVLDRLPHPWIAAPFYVIAMIGLVLLETSSSYSLLLLAGALMGLGLGTEYGVLPYFLSRYFGVRHYGAISGMIYGVIILIQGITPFLMDLNFDLSGNYRIAVVVICLAMLVGAFLLTRLQPYDFSSKTGGAV